MISSLPAQIPDSDMFGRRDLLEVLGAKEGDVGEDVPTLHRHNYGSRSAIVVPK